MGGPKKKGAGKKAKKAATGGATLQNGLNVTIEAARQLRAKLAKGESLTEAERLLILNASSDAKPVASSKDPNNIADLLPNEGGYRREGIWKKTVEAVVDVHAAASEERDTSATPAGLSNLGNTCYANSALQVLFTNRAFRCAIYRLEDEAVDGDGTGLLRELRSLFLELEFGTASCVNPTVFAEVLKLQANEQQDAQEFQKLLMQCLDERLARSADSEVRNVLRTLYCGGSSYVTTCRKCKMDSARSSDVSDFYELDLQVKGVKNLRASLAALVSADALEGNNKYSCENCMEKTDADRRFCVRKLPPCLRVNLQRFVFDWQSLSKQKCQDVMSFPMSVDFSDFVQPVASASSKSGSAAAASNEAAANGAQMPAKKQLYHLTAIILHRGSSASAGHYVAIVKDEFTNKWWKYDDETITDMGLHPFKGGKWDPVGDEAPKEEAAHAAVNSKAAGGKKGGAKRAKGAAAKAQDKTEGGGAAFRDIVDITESKDGSPGAAAGRKRAAGAAAANGQRQPPNKRAKGGGAAAKGAGAGAVPCIDENGAVVEAINAINASRESGDASAWAAGAAPEGAAASADRLPQELSSKDAYMLIYTKDGEQYGCCVSQSSVVDSLPSHAREKIQALREQQEAACKKRSEERARKLSAVRDRRDEIRTIIADMPVQDGDEWRLIDAEWLTKWANAPPDDSIPAIDNGDLQCPHGKLSPTSWSSAKRISALAWTKLQSRYGGAPEFGSQELCAECVAARLDEIVDKEDTDLQRKEILEEVKSVLDTPCTTEQQLLGSHSNHLVSRKWLQIWKTKQCRVKHLTECMSPTAAICCQHGRLLPELLFQNGKKKPSNRIAISEQTYGFIRRHWVPSAAKPAAAPEDNSASAAAAAALDSPGDAGADSAAATAAPSSDSASAPKGGFEVQVVDVDDGSEMPTDDAVDTGEASAKSQNGKASENAILREFRVGDMDRDECPECGDLISSTLDAESSVKSQIIRERNTLQPLMSQTLLMLEDAARYALVPRAWLKEWRAWITSAPWKLNGAAIGREGGAGGAAAAAKKLRRLDDAMAEVTERVDGEQRLFTLPPEIKCVRGRWTQMDVYNDLLTIIEWEHWVLLREFHGSDSTPDLPITFVLEPVVSASKPQGTEKAAAEGAENGAPAVAAEVATAKRDGSCTLAESAAAELEEIAEPGGSCTRRDAARDAAVVDVDGAAGAGGQCTAEALQTDVRSAAAAPADRCGHQPGSAACSGGTFDLTEDEGHASPCAPSSPRRGDRVPAQAQSSDVIDIESTHQKRGRASANGAESGSRTRAKRACVDVSDDGPAGAHNTDAALPNGASGTTPGMPTKGETKLSAVSPPGRGSKGRLASMQLAQATAPDAVLENPSGRRVTRQRAATGTDDVAAVTNADERDNNAAEQGATNNAAEQGAIDGDALAMSGRNTAATARALAGDAAATAGVLDAAVSDASDFDGGAGDEGAGGEPSTARTKWHGRLVKDFKVCMDTIEKRERAEREAALSYSDASIECQIVTEEQALKDTAPASSNKRSRRGRVEVKLSNTDTLRAVKLRLYNHLHVHPVNMDCYVKGRALQDDDAQLGKLGVTSRDTINIVKQERVRDDDYVTLVEWQQMVSGMPSATDIVRPVASSQSRERGFVDTLLVGGTAN